MAITDVSIATYLDILPTYVRNSVLQKAMFNQNTAAIAVRNYLAQAYGDGYVASILTNGMSEMDGDIMMASFAGYRLPTQFTNVNDPMGVAMERRLVANGTLTAAQILADMTRSLASDLSLDSELNLSVDGSGTGDGNAVRPERAPERKASDLFADSANWPKSNTLIGTNDFGGYQEVPRGFDFGNYQEVTRDFGAGSLALINQQASLMVQSMSAIDPFAASDQSVLGQDEESKPLIIANPGL